MTESEDEENPSYRGSRLSSHKQVGKTLVSLLMQMAGLNFSSWLNDRLPDMLWAVLLAGTLDRPRYISIFSKFLKLDGQEPFLLSEGITHRSLARLSPEEFDLAFRDVLEEDDFRQSLSSLFLFERLPDRHHWERALGKTDMGTGWHKLADAVASCIVHQSQQATDCRWLRAAAAVMSQQLSCPADIKELILGYPTAEDLSFTRPLVRATEIGLDGIVDQSDAEWPELFWHECLMRTECFAAERKQIERHNFDGLCKELEDLYRTVVQHFFGTLSTTAVDARHDTVFGIVLYSIALAYSAIATPNHRRVEGRATLRTLTECCIVISYLAKKDDLTLWHKFRNYGNGQAKLSFLKSLDIANASLPRFIRAAELEELADEDFWIEYVPINLGHWASVDLRRMSEEASVKNVYDTYYVWPSSYVHGQWAAIRNTVFAVCLNPLHRFHRIPVAPNFDMRSTTPSILAVMNKILDVLSGVYPAFVDRLSDVADDSEQRSDSGL